MIETTTAVTAVETEVEAETAIDLTALPAARLPYYLDVIDAGYGRRYWTLIDRASGESVGFNGSTGPESQCHRAGLLYGAAPTEEQTTALVWWAYQRMNTVSLS